MIAMTLAEIASAVGGVVHPAEAGDTMVRGAAYLDSREPIEGGLFVAIAGEHFDGHDHAGDAHAVLGTRQTDAPTVVVPDVEAALGDLARHVLAQLDQVVVYALTGSQGKTGTKDYLAQVLAADAPTVATRGNQNNELGVPLTVLRADRNTRHLVLEMGARHLGNIEYLCRVAPPDVAAVLNVGTAHIGEFGSQQIIAQTKGEIVEALGPEGIAVLAADDDLVAQMGTRSQAPVWHFGSTGEVTWTGRADDELGRVSFDLHYQGGAARVRLRELGAHQMLNATAAAAMALAGGLDLATVAEQLSAAKATSRWRMEANERADGALIVNDAYNANPGSMSAALTWLANTGQRSGRRTIAVLGGMRELGADEAEEHRLLGRLTADLGVDVLVTVGPGAEAIAEGARSVEDRGLVVAESEGRDEALAWLRDNVSARDLVLVKASRFYELEHVVAGLLDDVSTMQGVPR